MTKEELIEAAKKEFGITDICSRAGYILPNGEMLDFGDPYIKKRPSRIRDHSDVWVPYDKLEGEGNHPKPQKWGCYQTYAEGFSNDTGSLRLFIPATHQRYRREQMGMINIEKSPIHPITKKQKETLEYCNCLGNYEEVSLDEFYCEDDKKGYKNCSAYNSDDCLYAIDKVLKCIKSEAD